VRRIVVASIAVVLFVACANDDLAEQGERSRAGKNKNAASGQNGGGNRNPAKGNAPRGGGDNASQDAPDEIDSAAPGSQDAVAQAPQDFGGEDAPSGGIDPSLARAGASAQDPATDARTQGIAPGYTEATGASIQGRGQTVVLTMTFNGAVPNQVQKDQYMVVAFGITGRKEGQGFAIGATCDDNGWDPYAGSKGDSRKFPGTFEVSGNQIVMEMPWSFIQGPRAFEWYASTGWYGKIANQTHWSFDAVPNQKTARFPG